MDDTRPRPLILWGVSDGRAGHLTQVRGLMRALADRRPCQSFELPAPPTIEALVDLMLGRARFTRQFDDPPDLVIAAGHATHLPLICARRARGGRSVVLMRPSLPLRCFDLCIIPEHDGVAAADNVISSRGPINNVVTAPQRHPEQGLILIGGPSRHYRWDEDDLLRQIRALIADAPRSWVITDSPRTPASTSAALAHLGGGRVDYRSWRDMPAGWLQQRLGECGAVWVSEDSMSMIYESLSGGAATGLLDVPSRREASRIVKAVAALAQQGCVLRFREWRGGDPPALQQPFDEAGRCADILLERFDLQ